MEKIKSSEDNQGFLKVAKLNQMKSDELLATLEKENEKFGKSIDETESFISSIESLLSVKAPNIPIDTHPLILNESVKERDWQSLIEEANSVFPNSIGFEDLLSPDDIADVYRNLDEINKEFSQKTKLKKIDWIFLATATALQCIRQYVLDPWLKKSRTNAGNNGLLSCK